MIGLFALIQCWEEDLDGVVITRDDFKRLVGLRKIKGARVEMLNEDLETFFKNMKNYGDGKRRAFEGIVVSRRAIEKFLRPGLQPRSDENGNLLMKQKKGKPKIKFLKVWPSATIASEGAANAYERYLSTRLSQLANGQIPPRELFPQNSKAAQG
jgi:hypothetical protein